ncbi:hypothetical protein RB195_014576 [Necator americanus]|uniref:Uncharacterized protein n=1 Tax=Necator americanus TaxID=51031 RepID=A0ABR1E0R6_NECAM
MYSGGASFGSVSKDETQFDISDIFVCSESSRKHQHPADLVLLSQASDDIVTDDHEAIKSQNARTTFTHHDQHTLLGATECIKFRVIALEKRVGFVVHPSHPIHLADSFEIPSLRLAIFCLRPLHQKLIGIINCYSPTAADESELGAFYEESEEVVRNEKSFYIFVIADSSVRLGKAIEEYGIERFELVNRSENSNETIKSNHLFELRCATRLFMEILVPRRNIIVGGHGNGPTARLLRRLTTCLTTGAAV